MEDLVSAVEDISQETIKKILNNIVQSPSEPKFKTLKKENKMVADKICASPNALSLLLALDFEDCGSTLQCPEHPNIEQMGEVVELLECIIASRGEDVPSQAPASTGKAPEAATAPEWIAPRPTAASQKAALNPSNFGRREDNESHRVAQQNQIAELRAERAGNHANGYPATAAPPMATVPQTKDTHLDADAKKKPTKSAYDFESRSKKQDESSKATNSLQELRQQQKQKFQAFEADPDAKKQEAYQRPASVAGGGQVDQGWGGWFGGMFGGGSNSGSSSGGGGGRPSNDRPGPRIKTVSDLPKPVQRGGG